MKKKECIVHIGMHKTGSSSIQVTLDKKFKSEETCYFNLGKANHSRLILNLFSKHKKSIVEDDNSVIMKKMLESIENCPGQRMILSGEGIVKLTKKELEDFKDFLYQYFEQITIVAYVRSPSSFIVSAFQEIVKGGIYHFMLEKVYPNYRNKFRKFDLVFGRENVHLWKFDPKTFIEGDVVTDFCHKIDIKMNLSSVIRVNDSLSMEALSLLYLYGKYGSGTDIPNKGKVISLLQKIGKRKIQISPNLLNPIIDKNAKDILWMEDRLGETLNENISSGIDDIESEKDLLSVDSETLEALKDILNFDYVLPKMNINTDNSGEALALFSALLARISVKVRKN